MALTVWNGTGAELARAILAPRPRHLIVISQRTDHTGLNLDAEYIAAEADDVADVILVRNVNTGYELSKAMPAGWSVYGDSARVYRAGPDPAAGSLPSHPVVSKDRGGRARAAEELIDLAYAFPRPKASRQASALPTVQQLRFPEVRTGRVAAFIGAGELAWVEFPDGGKGTVRLNGALAGIRLDWLLAENQELSGSLDPLSRTLDITASVKKVRAGSTYAWGQVILCLVQQVAPDRATLAILPGETCEVTRADISSNPLDPVDELLTVGQVVPARLTQETGRRRLSLLDVDDDEPAAAAPVLIEGGIPWLELGRDLLPPSQAEWLEQTASPQETMQPPLQAPALRSVQLELHAARAEAMSLRQQLAAHGADPGPARDLQPEIDGLRRDLLESAVELEHLRSQLRRQTELTMKAQNRVRAAEKKNFQHRSQDSRFLDVESQFRHDLYLSWVERIDPREKKQQLLQDFSVGPKFLESFRVHPQELQAKALKAIVDLLTGRAARMHARELHPLRSGGGAEDSPRSRTADGAMCWRMAIESNSPAARRLHFWQVPGGGIELHQLVAHDVTVL